MTPGWPPRLASWPRRAAAVLACALATAPAAGFDLQGHRGARALAPENTLAGFDAALRIGVDTLELDVVLTRDGVAVVGHDPRLNPDLVRGADGRWLEAPTPLVFDLDLAALQRLDVGRLRPGSAYAAQFPRQQPVDGARMPTLVQLFEHLAALGERRVRFNVETKLTPLRPHEAPAPEDFVRAVVAVVDAHGVRGRVALQSFDWRTLDAARRIAPDVPRVALTMRSERFDNVADERWTAGRRLADHGGNVPRLVAAAGAQTWSPWHRNLTPEALAEAHALGLRVVPWTVNEAADIERMLALGVDGLISDDPPAVRAALAARGLPLPPATTQQRQ